jgi:pyridoxal/pyridoxine/pyridoxamine kinase
LGVSEVVATSIPVPGESLATLAITSDDVFEQLSPWKPSVPHGTGDFLAGLYLAERLEHEAKEALRRAMIVLQRAIGRSVGTAVLNITEKPENDHRPR